MRKFKELGDPIEWNGVNRKENGRVLCIHSVSYLVETEDRIVIVTEDADEDN